jgi:hypothetical protein
MKEKSLNERLCINCDNLEDEKHVLLKFPLYEDLRQSMFIDVVGHNNNFLILSDNEFIFYFYLITIQFVILLPKPTTTFYLEETVFYIINK